MEINPNRFFIRGAIAAYDLQYRHFTLAFTCISSWKTFPIFVRLRKTTRVAAYDKDSSVSALNHYPRRPNSPTAHILRWRRQVGFNSERALEFSFSETAAMLAHFARNTRSHLATGNPCVETFPPSSIKDAFADGLVGTVRRSLRNALKKCLLDY
jgi:hypothetical protein